MRKFLAWLGLATLILLPSAARVQAAGATVLKPYIVLILDVSGSMLNPTGSGPPSCPDANGNALPDTKLNHARCAVQNIVNSYGDIVFAYARFHENAGTSGSTGAACGTNATSPTNCTLAQDACTTDSDRFQLMTALVDGTNANTAKWSDFSCSTCTPSIPFTAGQDPEVWHAAGSTPIQGSLAGAKCYWEGENALSTGAGCSPTSGVVLWPSGTAGFSPIVNDPTNGQFLGATGCDPSPTCTSNCCAQQCRPYIVVVLTDGDETCGGTEGHCSVTKSTLCNPAAGTGCPGTETCVFGPGNCSVTTGTSCFVNADCPGGETCVNAASVPAAAAAMLRTDVSTGSPASLKRYRVVTKPIGFGTPTVPYGPIENLAYGGGAPLTASPAGYYAADEAGLELAMSQIIEGSIRSESCNNLDDDCDGAIDEDFPQKGQACDNGQNGVCKGTGVYVCTADGTGVTCVINNPGQPPQTSCPPGKTCNPAGDEICGDNLDNDCDGFVDEGCTACLPGAEICNGKDDDCDGVVDEDVPPKACGNGSCFPNAACCGVELCTNGAYDPMSCSATWTPVPEVCNGIDDDCDGSVDEDLTNPCSNITGNGCGTAPCPGNNNPGSTSQYRCQGDDTTYRECSGPTDTSCPGGAACVLPIPENVCHPGQQACTGGNPGSCTGEVTPTPEICNGLDDDCDNVIDEDTGGGSCTTSCGVGTIVCATPPNCGGTGQPACGTLYCNAQPGTDDNTCNGIDDDCDGKVDEDWQCGGVNGSIPNVPCTCGSGTTCEKTECINGTPTCVQTAPISPEQCNCLDDDCDGTVDEGQLCGGGAMCIDCQCAFQCSGGEFPCPSGKKCTQGYCVDDPCFGVTCGKDANGNAQTCVENATTHQGQCVDVCDPTVTMCPTGLRCYGPSGQCEPDDCTSDFPDRKCQAGQNCIVDPNTGIGMCVANPCAGVTCPSDQYCEAGNCIASCATISCPKGQRCQLGACEPDPCGGPCPAGKVCNDATGTCIDNPCQFRNCATGQYCNPNDGMCEVDPCVGTACPADPPGQVCRGGTCYPAGAFGPDGGAETHVTVAGGGCSTGGGSSAGLLVALGLLLVRRRRTAGGAK